MKSISTDMEGLYRESSRNGEHGYYLEASCFFLLITCCSTLASRHELCCVECLGEAVQWSGAHVREVCHGTGYAGGHSAPPRGHRSG